MSPKRISRPGRDRRHHRAGHPGQRARQDALDAFASWVDDEAALGGDAEDYPSGREVAAALDAILQAASQQISGLDPAHPHVASLGRVLEDVDEHGEPEMIAVAAFSIDAFLHHLEQRGGWRGDETELTAAIALAHVLLDDVAVSDVEELIAGADLDPDAGRRRADLDATVLVSAVTQLLTWIGRSRPVTSTGVLRRADIAPAARLLGIAAVGVATRSQAVDLAQDEFDLGLSTTPADDETRVVTSMRDIEELAAWWSALLAVGVLETTVTTVRPGPRAGDWGAADPDVSLSVREDLISAFVTVLVGDQDTPMGWFVVQQALMLQLAIAVRPDLKPEASSLDLVTPADDTDPSGPVLQLIVGGRTEATMTRLAHLGLVDARAVESGTRFVVPGGLRPAVATGVRRAELLLAGELDDEPTPDSR